MDSEKETGINTNVQGELVLSAAEGSPCWGAKKIKLGQILTGLFIFYKTTYNFSLINSQPIIDIMKHIDIIKNRS